MTTTGADNSLPKFDDLLQKVDDNMLVQAAKSGDGAAFAELARRHSKSIQLRLYRIVGNWEDAQDLVQDSLLRAFRHLESFQGRCSFSTWLTAIAINSALMKLRTRRRHAEVSFSTFENVSGTCDIWDIPDHSPSPESICFVRERADLIRGAIQRLPPDYRSVIAQREAGESSMLEIAQALGITVAATKSRLSRAKSALRGSLPRAALSFSS